MLVETSQLLRFIRTYRKNWVLSPLKSIKETTQWCVTYYRQAGTVAVSFAGRGSVLCTILSGSVLCTILSGPLDCLFSVQTVASHYIDFTTFTKNVYPFVTKHFSIFIWYENEVFCLWRQGNFRDGRGYICKPPHCIKDVEFSRSGASSST
jgi:hypothetical protein